MASEPAEPTTRPQDELIEKAARVMRSVEFMSGDPVVLPPGAAEAFADALLANRLLADPAQTTELEELRAQVEQLLPLIEEREEWRRGMHADVAEINRLSLLLRGMARKLVAYRKWTLGDDVPEVHRLRRELAEARARKQADLDELKRTLGLTRNTLKQNVEWRDRFRAERDEDRAELGETRRERDLLLWLHAEAAWRVAGFDVLTVALARRNHQLTAERDERQTRIDRALAVCEQHITFGPVPSPAANVCRQLRAALAGDQPPVEEPYRCPTLCDDDCESPCHEAHAIPRKRQHDVADCEARQPLSGEALRNAEERDDASEPSTSEVYDA